LSAHFLFIDADPDIGVSFSRGAWTDEGMYTSQIKNAVINNEIDLHESTCFVITPLFSTVIYFPYKLFGWSSLVSRLTVLVSCFLIISFMFFKIRETKNLLLILIPIIFLEEHIFHFMHYSLAEMLAIFFAFVGCLFLYRSLIEKDKKNYLYSTFFFTCSYLFKIQFLYVMLIIPVFLFLWFVFQVIIKNRNNSYLKTIILKFSIAIVCFFGLYLLVWYLPNKEMINLVLNDSVESRAIQSEQLNVYGIIIDYLLNIKKFLILSIHTTPIVLVSLFFMPLGIFFLFFTNASRFFQINFLISISWIIVEMHKFSMNYLPTRYLLSLYFAMGLLIAIVFCEAIMQFKARKKSNIIVFCFSSLCLLIFSVNNFKELKRSYDSRTYDIEQTNEYFSQYQYDNRPIMGTWASSLARDAEVITIPFFENYINHKNILKRLDPKVIIFEEIEEKVLINDAIDINEISDSIVTKKVGKYELKIAWLK